MYHLLMSGSAIGYILQILPFSILMTVLICILKKMFMNNYSKSGLDIGYCERFFTPLFICYIMALVGILVPPPNFWDAFWQYIFNGYSGCEIGAPFSGGFNFAPFFIPVLQGKLILGKWVKEMLLYNTVLFIPMGWFMGQIHQTYRVKKKHIFLFFLLCLVGFEFLQPLFGRCLDIDDIIMRSFGTLIGLLFYKAFHILIKSTAAKPVMKNNN